MKRAHRDSSRFFRVLSLHVCLALVSCSLAWPVTNGANRRGHLPSQAGSFNAQEGRVTPLAPRTGPPAANLPNLDEVKHRTVGAPRAPVSAFARAFATQAA